MQEKIQRITARTIIVGIDVAKEVHWARITDYRGVDLMKPCKVHNSTEGFENLLAKVESACVKQFCDQVIIAMEPSGHYWKAMGWYLKLHESKPMLVGVNPYHVKQSKELDDNSYESQVKHCEGKPKNRGLQRVFRRSLNRCLTGLRITNKKRQERRTNYSEVSEGRKILRFASAGRRICRASPT